VQARVCGFVLIKSVHPAQGSFFTGSLRPASMPRYYSGGKRRGVRLKRSAYSNSLATEKRDSNICKLQGRGMEVK
jgi:hypothetical protein